MTTLASANFNDALPAAPSGRKNVKWQADSPTMDPRNISAYVSNIGTVDARTTVTETIALAALGKLVTFNNAGAIAVTLDSTVPTDFFCFVEDLGAGTATLTPSSGTINGVANLALATGSGGILFFDGTNWTAVTGGGGGGAGTVTHSLGALTAGQLIIGNGGADIAVGDLSGDVTTAGGTAATVAKIQGTTVGGTTGSGKAVFDTSPTLSNPVVGTQAANDNSTKAASTAYVDGKSQPFDVLFNPNQVLGSGAIYDVAVFVRTVVFPGNFSGSAGKCRVNPGTTQTINVNKNGSQIGQISISNAGVFTFTTAAGAAQTYNAGDYMTLTNQAGADANMVMQVTLTGTR